MGHIVANNAALQHTQVASNIRKVHFEYVCVIYLSAKVLAVGSDG